ncbi:MAG: amino acid ABC transporter ATP-binding protein [Proteobacteria bacterium]|nr:amino acid ABC transporter ATP-binding protein [Pseudomonadota bacterium]
MKLELRSVSKSFFSGGRPQKALMDVSFDTDFPHVLALIGPSGGGKSTLLRILAGLTSPDSGEVMIDGAFLPKAERELRAYRSRLGVVFQAYNLFPHMTALANVMLPLVQVHGIPEAEARGRALQIMERLGLADHADKHPLQLSGGQSQRVAIARALAPKPELLLFDEPTSALDPEMTAEVLKLIAELKESHTPMILVTHEIGFARKIADRIAFLAEGRVLEEGVAAEFFADPRSEEARRFLAKVLAY